MLSGSISLVRRPIAGPGSSILSASNQLSRSFESITTALECLSSAAVNIRFNRINMVPFQATAHWFERRFGFPHEANKSGKEPKAGRQSSAAGPRGTL
jgi:hypothetical protein